MAHTQRNDHASHQTSNKSLPTIQIRGQIFLVVNSKEFNTRPEHTTLLLENYSFQKEQTMTNEQERQSIISRIVEETSRHLEIRAALICGAPDPLQMVEWLEPIITDRHFDGGAIPPMYHRIAEFEMRLRRAKAQRQPTTSNLTH
jgi:hypothetical protein